MSYSYSYDGTTKLPTGYTLTNSDGNNATYTYSYDAYKRIEGITEDNTYARFIKTVTYDDWGRVYQEASAATNKNTSTTQRRAVINNYEYGILKSIADSTSGTTLYNITGQNARGQVTEAYMGGSSTLKQLSSYDSDGMLTELKTNKLSGTPATLMTLGYSFNATRGNLDSRSNNAFATTWSEDFDYDELDRLTDFNDNNGSRSQGYEGSGRIASNSRLGTYTYGSNPYQQTGLSSLTDYAKYHYQNDPLQEVTYNAFKAPTRIQEQGKEKIDFQYNGGLGRSTMYYGSEDTAKTARPFRRHYSEDGSVEITEDLTNSKTTMVFYLGGDAYSAPAIWKYETSGLGASDAIYYLHRDHIGSINLITDASGNAVEKRQFDAWGQIVKLEDGGGNPLTAFGIIDRGYTGHEHLLGVGLINMNARLYDPILHRFLGPDNNIQDPTNTQSYNRYGYVWNNPLKYIDPSGELVDGQEEENARFWSDLITHIYDSRSPFGGNWNPETGYQDFHSDQDAFDAGYEQLENSGHLGYWQDQGGGGSTPVGGWMLSSSVGPDGVLILHHDRVTVGVTVKQVATNKAGYDTAPSLKDLKDNPPNHPEYQPPKNGPERKVKNPGGGNDMGWLDRKGRVWIPNDNNGNHSPHWDRQRKDGNGWDNIYPEINPTNVVIGIGAAIGIGIWEGVKWGTAIIGVPETGGASLSLLAIP